MSNLKQVYFDPHSGRAVILLEEKPIFLEVKDCPTADNPSAPQKDPDFLKWFRFDQCKLVHIDIGEPPYVPLRMYMLFHWSVQKLVYWFDLVLNHEHTQPFRCRAANAFETLYLKASPDVAREFERIKLETPIQKNMKMETVPFKEGGAGVRIWNEMSSR